VLATVITAFIAGLGGILFQWLRDKQAQQNRDKARALEALVVSDAQKTAAEKEITIDAKEASASAAADFTALR
jgi:hypothetical protein